MTTIPAEGRADDKPVRLLRMPVHAERVQFLGGFRCGLAGGLALPLLRKKLTARGQIQSRIAQ